MPDVNPVACSLGPDDLDRRLAAIAAIGAGSLLGRASEDGRHVLRFRGDDAARRGLDELVAAEARCCSFLTLALTESAGELVLTITAPEEGRQVAGELALAFGSPAG
jgi:hypothetical protein